MLKVIMAFINYWYYRYLLVTELYMVEKWERAMFHIIVFVLLSFLYLFNTTVTMGLVRMVTNYIFNNEISSEYGLPGSSNYNEL